MTLLHLFTSQGEVTRDVVDVEFQRGRPGVLQAARRVHPSPAGGAVEGGDQRHVDGLGTLLDEPQVIRDRIGLCTRHLREEADGLRGYVGELLLQLHQALRVPEQLLLEQGEHGHGTESRIRQRLDVLDALAQRPGRGNDGVAQFQPQVAAPQICHDSSLRGSAANFSAPRSASSSYSAQRRSTCAWAMSMRRLASSGSAARNTL